MIVWESGVQWWVLDGCAVGVSIDGLRVSSAVGGEGRKCESKKCIKVYYQCSGGEGRRCESKECSREC